MIVVGVRSATFLAVAALLVGCGSSKDGSKPSAPNAPVAADLSFSYRAGPSAKTDRVDLACPAASDRLPAACRELEAVPSETFDKVPPGRACTEIYGGPETLRVVGRIGGSRVDSRFSRINGCEISRWDALAPLLEELGLGAVGTAPPR